MTVPSPAQPAPIAPRPTMDTALFNRYAELVYQLTGNRIADSKNYFLTSKIDQRCREIGVADPAAYYEYVTTGPDRHKEVTRLVDEVTIHETFFFRNEPQLKAFEEDILRPAVQAAKARGQRTMRIWSAAASTGDEAYTTALQLIRSGLINELQFEIVGTDISHKAIAAANAGYYNKYSIRNIPPEMLARYFTTTNETHFTIHDDIKRLVTFKVANLKEKGNILTLGKFDLVMCRNVLIYFDKDSKEQVLWNIYEAMHDNSVLLVGHSENLYAHKHIFRSDTAHPNAFAYTKAPPGTEKLHV